MGFWHTGYMDFHEPTGLEGSYKSAPIVYHCQHCSAQFETTDALLEHRLVQHPYLRPLLFIRGQELGSTPLTLNRPLQPDEVRFSRCDQAQVNGQSIPLSQLGAYLAEFRNDKVNLELRAPNVSARFDLLFAVAAEPDCQGIEQNLLTIARQHTLNERTLEIFVSASRPFTTAINYCDGIYQYLYGVLAKERALSPVHTGQGYLERFCHADDTLKGFDRPLARTIRALIAFHFNHFTDAAAWMPEGYLGAAAQRFAAWIQGDPDPMVQQANDPLTYLWQDRQLSDFDTDQILRWTLSDWATLTPHVEQIHKRIRQADLPDYDLTKLKILLAEYFCANHQPHKARPLVLELIHAPALSTWADRLKNRLAL